VALAAVTLTSVASFAFAETVTCVAPRVTPASPSAGFTGAFASIEFFTAQASSSATATAVRLSVIAREPEGKQLARAEAILPADAVVWRPALNEHQLAEARRVKLIYELQAECGNARSVATRHQITMDLKPSCELTAAPVLKNHNEIVWFRLPHANRYEVCLQRADERIRCAMTADDRYQLDRNWTSLDSAVVTPICKRGIGNSLVVKAPHSS